MWLRIAFLPVDVLVLPFEMLAAAVVVALMQRRARRKALPGPNAEGH